MNELDAINMLLRLIGSSPINNVATPHPDAGNARATLNRIRKQCQRRGWWFNIDYGVVYQPQSDGKIVIADEISTFVAEDKGVVQRGKFLYNKYNNTYIFKSNVVAQRIVREVEWDEMPSCVQEYCAYLAGAQFVRDELEDNQKQRSLEESAGIAMIDIKKQDLEEGRYNVFDNSRIARARLGVRPYQRGNKRFFGSPDA